MSAEVAPKDIPGLSGIIAGPVERVPIRARGRSVTLSAWRLEVTSGQGPGAIVLAEVSSAESYYRGEGVFLGWPQEQLASAWGALRPGPSGPELELPQLG